MTFSSAIVKVERHNADASNSLESVLQDRTIYLDQTEIRLRPERLTSGVLIAAYDAADVRISPIYQIGGLETLQSSAQ